MLVQVLRSPRSINNFNTQDWNLLLRQAHSSKMLTRLSNSFYNHNVINLVPEKVLNHINSEQVKVAYLQAQVKREVQELNELFDELNINAIYLKGTAYLLAELPVAEGRVFSDIDILINQSDIDKVEISLKCRGWKSQKTEDHDQEYYRKYMHEIPPLQNILRGTVIDIHHNILPVCNDKKIDIDLLTDNSLTLNDINTHKYQNQILAPDAMFLHSAIHLFHEGELEQGLRGLSDLDILFSYFEENETNFSQQLINLSEKINQQESLFYAWRYLDKVLNRQLPKAAQLFVSSYQEKIKSLAITDFIFLNLLDVHHSTRASWKFSIAVIIAYWRGHLLRMPLRLLIPHLIKKLWLQLCELTKKDPVQAQQIDALNPRFQKLDDD